ncbi:MAG: hypoxanthine phosphoribosyltransferase [Candidatus Eremiobacteraeota bacterium]|nr:hypoxanthine phosphoribosyltransferase [Candidatus Eremiobacteraeota bacterium]MBV8372291.1 hypoxanthine phosphoribosyltransferase [Candidatus Eremiobacteraeota bacterium]
MGDQISRDYAGHVPLLIARTPSSPFLTDLLRAISVPCELDVISVNRFGEGEGIDLARDAAVAIEGRHVILVDDTIDTGLTLQYVFKRLLARAPESLAVCALLDRPHRRIADVQVRYRGFEAPDVYLVGYGLDYLGRYRELPALYAHGTWPRS